MNPELESMLDRADEILRDLETEYNKCLKAKRVTDRAKNLAPEVLAKLKSVLDHTMRRAWEIYIAPNLSEKTRKSARVYFPIADDLNSLHSILGRWGIKDLDKINKKLYDFLLKQQPFSSDKNRWLVTLAKIAGEGKHVRLIPQKLTERIRRIKVTGPAGGSVSWDPSSVKFGVGVSIMGTSVDPKTQRVVPTPGVTEKVEILLAFIFDSYGVNALGFCREACQKTRALIEEMANALKL
jgi:hypothetical protein